MYGPCMQYHAELECTVPYDATNPVKRQAVLEWIMRYAVHLEYSDTGG